MENESLIIMRGTKYTSILRGMLNFKDNLVNIEGKYKGFIKSKNMFMNIPIEYVEKETELVVDNEPTGTQVYFIRQSFDGEAYTTLFNSKYSEMFNSLMNENLSQKREINHLRKLLFDSKHGDRVKERAYQDMKWAGKVRATSWFGGDGEQPQYDRFNRFNRFPMTGLPPIE